MRYPTRHVTRDHGKGVGLWPILHAIIATYAKALKLYTTLLLKSQSNVQKTYNLGYRESVIIRSLKCKLPCMIFMYPKNVDL